jgi:hypothetical protein
MPGVATKACVGPACVGPAVGISGGGGLARRATMASAAGAILAIVAATSTAIAVFIVIFGPIATDAAVAAMGRARQRGRRRLGRRGRNIGVECRRGSRRPRSRSSQTLRKFRNGEEH